VTTPGTKANLHRLPQAIPAGRLLTVPLPTLRISNVASLRTKVAMTVVSAVTASEQVGLLPAHPPDHPEKVEPAAGVAVSVTVWPCMKSAEQVGPQLTALVVSLTVPLPEPAF
jgi:hypothetical protein